MLDVRNVSSDKEVFDITRKEITIPLVDYVMYTELIDQLGKTDSKVIPLFRLGLKQREIAEIMGVTQANISRVRRRIEKIVLCE